MTKQNAFVLTSAIIILSFSLLFLFSYLYRAKAFAELKERRDILFEIIKSSANDIADDFVILYDDGLSLNRINDTTLALSFSLNYTKRASDISDYLYTFLPMFANLSNINVTVDVPSEAFENVFFTISSSNNTPLYSYAHLISASSPTDEAFFLSNSTYYPILYFLNISVDANRKDIVTPSLSSTGIPIKIVYEDRLGNLNIQGYINETTSFIVWYSASQILNVTFYVDEAQKGIYVSRNLISRKSTFEANILIQFPENETALACLPILINVTSSNVNTERADYVVDMPCFFSG